MDNVLKLTVDSFKNFVAGLGTDRDKQVGGEYALLTLTDQQWSVIYRTSWMGRKVVDIPAEDATRKWRNWQAEEDQIEEIEEEEKRLLVPQKVKLALQQARLFGGSGIYFSITGDDPEKQLVLETIKKGSLAFATVLSRSILVPGQIELDPMAEGYGKPQYYEVSSTGQGTVRIHPSRLAIFVGNEVLTPEEMIGRYQGWGDSVLQSVYEALRNADSTASNIASLVYESKIDVLQIPNLAALMANPRHRELLEQRVALSAQLKGNNGMLIIDGEEKYEQKSFTFSGLTDINSQAMQAVSGAADIPITRFLGQSPGGLNATGEGDLKNYYDSVASKQALGMTPALFNLDEALIRSALGDRPEDIWYEWASLWQMSDEQQSRISKETADTIGALVAAGIFPEAELGEAAANLLVERGVFPAFDIDAAMLEEVAEEKAAVAEAESAAAKEHDIALKSTAPQPKEKDSGN